MKTNRKNPGYSFQHTKERMWERHQLLLSQSNYESLCDRIRSGKGKTISDEPQNRQKVVELNYCGAPLRFVWSEERDCITTVLP